MLEFSLTCHLVPSQSVEQHFPLTAPKTAGDSVDTALQPLAIVRMAGVHPKDMKGGLTDTREGLDQSLLRVSHFRVVSKGNVHEAVRKKEGASLEHPP